MAFLRKMFLTKIGDSGKQPSILSLIFSNPENFKLEAWIENDEVKITIKRKENKNELD